MNTEATPYDRLNELTESSNAHRAALEPLMVTISQILNGGCEQLADNDHIEEAKSASLMLGTLPAVGMAQEFKTLLDAALPDMERWMRGWRDRMEMSDLDVGDAATKCFGDGTPCDALEDWLYADKNAGPLYTELLAHFTA